MTARASAFASLQAAAPFALDAPTKRALFSDALAELCRHHAAHCPPYRNMLANLGFDGAQAHELADYPPLPARLFKSLDLVSVPETEIRKLLTSSGTGGQAPSRIHLDAATAALQTRALSRIVADFIGRERLPMLVIDAPSTLASRTRFSARAAGILGFSMFGRQPVYALNDDMTPDLAAIDAFLERHGAVPILLFGFTFVVFQHFARALKALGRTLPLEQGVLIHGGGWKKLADQAVDNATFKRLLRDVAGIRRVHNYYGLVEQAGSIFMECGHGHLHCSNYSDILVRGADFSLRSAGETGMLELFSLLPRSYPGHVLLTEDEGTLLGEDDCPCGRKGRYFQVHGRLPQAEIRGCGDTHASH